MAITTLDGLIAAAKQTVLISKTASITSAALPNNATTVFHLAGDPGAGTLAVGNTANGVVPTDATAGFPVINFSTGTGYISRIIASSSVACTLFLYDRLWHGGAYAFNASQAVTPSSYSSRVPGGTDYTGTELWMEQVTAGTLVQNIAVTYTNQAGTTSRSTGTWAAPAAMIVGRACRIPLQAGDTGIQAVTNVVGSVASAGTFNIMVLRPLAAIRIPVANAADVLAFDRTGLPVIFGDSALNVMVQPDSTASGLPYLAIDIANG